MHLSDEQLLELDKSGHLHIDQCESCYQRVNNLNKIRLTFQTMPQNSLLSGSWQKIQNERQQSIELKKTRKELSSWKISSFALAASLTVVMLWPISQSPPTTQSITNQELDLLIEQNRELQQQLDSTTQLNYLTKVNYQLIHMDIQSIDQAIQRAYLQKASDELKSELWEKRKQLVNQLLSRTKKIQTLTI
jgi:hypothetical protein